MRINFILCLDIDGSYYEFVKKELYLGHIPAIGTRIATCKDDAFHLITDVYYDMTADTHTIHLSNIELLDDLESLKICGWHQTTFPAKSLQSV